jgi:hypothetical protein
MLRKLLLITLCCVHLFALSQPKTLTAVKTTQAPRIDGNLDDAAWQQSPLATDFTQSFPSFGAPASAKTEVHLLYDDDAVYIGAYLYDDPALIRKQITARDGESRQDVDYFSVFFDTYNDQQNGFQFLVTTSNVQSDARIGSGGNLGFGDFGDKTWDAVWQSQVQMKSNGWTVEMRIPYISLRFLKKDVQTWGLQLLRFFRRNNESTYWSPVDPNINGFANQFGKLAGLKNIQPPLRLSFSPYLLTGVRVNPPVTKLGTQWLRSGGMDVKYGINESFTLDATLIPDFGQVVSDDVVNNLTPFEVRFQENRPFFTEGTELFNKSGLFYSRRIGAIPSGYYSIQQLAGSDPNLEIVRNPSVTKLYNAIKFSGRTKNKLGIGVFNAVAAPMDARLYDKTTGKKMDFRTTPMTNYNIVVLDQALRGRSYVAFTNASTIRNGPARDANVSALDFSLYDKNNNFSLKGTGRYSKIFSGEDYDGFNTMLRAGKVSGRIQYFAQADVKSTRYDPRDLGYLQTANQVTYNGSFSINQLTATDKFLSYSYTLNTLYQRLYEPNAYSLLQTTLTGFWWFRNSWDVSLKLGGLPDQHDYFVLGQAEQGIYVKRPGYGFAQVSGSSDSRKKLFFSYDVLVADFFGAKPDKNYQVGTLGLRYRFTNKFSLSVEVKKEHEKNYIVNADTTELSGKPIIGFVNFKEITSTFSGNYNFTSRISLAFRIRHYWSKVPFGSFADVDENGNPIPRPFINGRDENVNYFNTDAFLNWNFKDACHISLGYKNWLGDEYGIDQVKYPGYFGNLGKTFRVIHGNELSLKFIYFLDYNQLKR